MDAADGDAGGLDADTDADFPCGGNEGAVDPGVWGCIDDADEEGTGGPAVVVDKGDVTAAAANDPFVVMGEGAGFAEPPAAAAYRIGGSIGFTGAFDGGRPAFNAEDMG